MYTVKVWRNKEIQVASIEAAADAVRTEIETVRGWCGSTEWTQAIGCIRTAVKNEDGTIAARIAYNGTIKQ